MKAQLDVNTWISRSPGHICKARFSFFQIERVFLGIGAGSGGLGGLLGGLLKSLMAADGVGDDIDDDASEGEEERGTGGNLLLPDRE